MEKLKIALGSDHGGYNLKERIKDFYGAVVDFEDYGTHSTESMDYPIIAKAVAKDVAAGKFDRGILVCGTGIGMSIVANKFKGIRAAVVGDKFSAKATREHNDSNILCLGERVLDQLAALDIVGIWINTKFEGGRHQKRVDMIE